MIKPGTYRHYKGQFYNVIGIAKHSETLEGISDISAALWRL